MLKHSWIQGICLVLVGSLLGYAAAIGAFDFKTLFAATVNQRDQVRNVQEPTAVTPETSAKPACCDKTVSRQTVLAQADSPRTGSQRIDRKAATTTKAPSSVVNLTPSGKKPNILVIMGDDIGYSNVSIYSHGMLGYRTPNIDRIAREGALFTDAYGEQSCTAGRAAFILGQHPFRTGLLTIGMPGSTHGITKEMPTLAELLKPFGYATGHFGKNHLGDQDEHLPTNHGFDEFFGNLYHLNAEEEPESYYYPKDPAFKKKFGPRGVIHSHSDGRIKDTGPLTVSRMPRIDEEFHAAAIGSSIRPMRPRSRFSSGIIQPGCTSGRI
ncbi:MAG: arylsulfatase [Planctomycetaceae bacterium]|nr:arylsulfatase [Planctomycetaceae bacterium]